MNELTSVLYTQTPNYKTFSPKTNTVQNKQFNVVSQSKPSQVQTSLISQSQSQSHQNTQNEFVKNTNDNGNREYLCPIKSTLNKCLEKIHHTQQDQSISHISNQPDVITNVSKSTILQTSDIQSILLDESDTDSDNFDLIVQEFSPINSSDKTNKNDISPAENKKDEVVQENDKKIENIEIKYTQPNIPNSQNIQSQNDVLIPDISQSLSCSSQSATIPVSVTHSIALYFIIIFRKFNKQ